MFFTLKSSLSIVPYSAAITFNEMWKKIWRKEKRAAVVESSAAAAGAQWVAVESSTAAAGWSAVAEAQCVAAGWSTAVESSMAAARWSAPEYRSDSFKKLEREREREEFLLSLILGWSISSSTLARYQGARLGTWVGEERGEGEGSALPLPTSQGA